MNNISINELATRTMAALLNRGIGPYSVWNEYGHSFLPIIRLHELHGKEQFDRDIVTEYVRSTETRYDNGELSLASYKGKKRGAQRLTEFHDTGRLEWSAPTKVSRFILNE
jgi:hypothetical protein